MGAVDPQTKEAIDDTLHTNEAIMSIFKGSLDDVIQTLQQQTKEDIQYIKAQCKIAQIPAQWYVHYYIQGMKTLYEKYK
jgi:hypothetical protein